ncbi:MAG: DUF433 domain-containing protein [Isosphaeraceae bacterium]
MSTALQYPHLLIDAEGNARIDGTRYKVIHLASEHYHHGWSAEEILRQHPDLRPEQVYAALTYFYDHRDRLVREMEETAAAAERAAAAQPTSRAELLRRRAERGS